MKPLTWSLGRLALFMGTAFGAAYYVNSQHHESYWHGTIHRVQTVDFNILAHMLPTKLSYAIVRDDMEELQRTIESNYGHFGLVVTDCRTALPDCPGQEIFTMNSSLYGWYQGLEERGINYLLETEAPYDVLRYPPPLLTEGGYDDSRDEEWNDTGRENLGEIVGRVYYVRGVPPTFRENYLGWFQQWPQSFYKDSQAYRYYGLTATLFFGAGLGGWVIIEMLLAKNRVKERQLDSTKQQLHQTERNLAYAQRLLQDLERRLQQQQRLLADREVERQRLSQELQTREAQLRQQKDFRAETEHQQNDLEDLLQTLQNRDLTAQEDLRRRSEKISQLEVQIEELQRQQQDHQVNHVDRLRELQELLRRLQALNSDAQEEIRQRNEQITKLEEQIQSLNQQGIEAEERERKLQDEYSSLAKTMGELQAQLEQTRREVDEVQRQRDEIEGDLREFQDRELNPFEACVVQCLRRTSRVEQRNWLIHPNVDVHRGSERQFVDCVVIGPSFVAVIEAKSYAGIVEAEGDPKQTPWYARKNSGERIHISSTRTNPYVQVSKYGDSVMRRLGHEFDAKRIKVYGIVVFPDNAKVDAVSAEINGYGRVATLNKLIPTLRKVESEARYKTRNIQPRRSPTDIENLFFGRKM